MNDEINHLTMDADGLKGVKFTDTPRDPSEPKRITAADYSELLVLINNQMKENARVRGELWLFKGMAFWAFVVSLALAIVPVIFK